MNEQLEVKYGLPKEVKFCNKCVMSNQRPASTAEFKHTINSKKVTLKIDENGVCDACKMAEKKEKIDWVMWIPCKGIFIFMAYRMSFRLISLVPRAVLI